MTDNSFIPENPEEEIQIVSAKLSASTGDLVYYVTLLSPEEQVRVRSLCISSKRTAYTLTHGILHILLGSFLSREPEAVIIRYNQTGVPYTDDKEDEVRFSLSYSGDYALYALSRTRVPGIDVQQWGTVRSPHRFARRYFTAEESALLADTLPPDSSSLFYRIWTRKEACTKALGMGRAIPFDSFEVRPDIPSPKISITPPDGNNFLLAAADFAPAQGYSASAAVLSSGTVPRFTRESFNPRNSQ